MKGKKMLSGRFVFFILFVVLFIAGQLLGGYSIRRLYLNSKLKELEPTATEMAEDYVEGDFHSMRKSGNSIVKYYDTDGNEIDTNIMGNHIKPDDIPEDQRKDFELDKKEFQGRQEDEDYSEAAKKYMPKILQKETVATLEKIDGLASDTVVIGVPILQEDEVIGGLFMLVPASEYKATLNGFYLVFSVTLIFGIILFGIFFKFYVQRMGELEETRRDYVANISHELKSPIASIRALTETLCDGMVQDEETQERYYSIILSETGRLERLVLDMLELSRMQSHKMDFSKTVVASSQIFEPVCEKYAALCDDNGILFHVSDAVKNLPELHTNAEQITQLLVIFLDNAVKFVGEDGEIWLDVKKHGRKVTVFIRDNGAGIDEEIVPHIFDRFYKEDKAHNTKGSGLGLAIAKEIAMGLNEKIDVESILGKGSTFSFTIQVK